MQRIMSLLAAEIAFWLRLARMGTREHVMAQRVSLPTLPTAELLPSGHATIEAIADRLAMSKRTLQRRLGDEGQSFRQQLDRTLDYLFHSPKLQRITGYVRQEDTQTISDHLPVVGRFLLPAD